MKLTAEVFGVRVGPDIGNAEGRTVTFKILWPHWGRSLELDLTEPEARAYPIGRRVEIELVPERNRK